MTQLVNPTIAVLTVIEKAYRPPPPADLNLWARENVEFGDGESQFPGRYKSETNPPMARILECLGPEHPARVVTLKASVQIFKTTVAIIFIGAWMDIVPGPILYVLPTHDNALRWAHTKWGPIRKRSKVLTRIFGEVRSRDSKDTTLYQERRDGLGWLQISGANSEASLAMISVRCQVQDDLSKWEGNEAGDPERQADGRSSAFDWAKIFKISSPRLADSCRISAAYKAGTQERYHVPCPHCDHRQALEWPNFHDSIDPEHPERAHFTCMSCGAAIEHKHKTEIIGRGAWVADNPRAKDPSFHIWRAYAPYRDWESIAREWLVAKGNPGNEQVFFNEVLGLEFEASGEAPAWEAVRARAEGADASGQRIEGIEPYERGIVPLGALRICIGVDCQGDRVEVHIKGFGAGLRRWTINYLVIPHHISTVECRDALDKILASTWPDVFGNRRRVDMLAIDGNAFTNDVFGWVKERRHHWDRVIIVRGANSHHAPPLAQTKTERRPDGKPRPKQKRFYNVGVSSIKLSFYSSLKIFDPLARSYCGYPKGLDIDFYMQLTAERRIVTKNRMGYPVASWKKVFERNEVLDTEVYAEAAARRCGWADWTPEDWEALRREIEKPREIEQSDMFDPANQVGAAVSATHPVAAVTPPPRAGRRMRGEAVY